jgi:hypothetical protein
MIKFITQHIKKFFVYFYTLNKNMHTAIIKINCMKEILLHSLGFKVNPRFNSASTYGGSFICRSLKFPGPGVGLSVHRFYSTSSSGSNTIIYLAESRRSYSTLRKNEQF